MSPRPPPVLAVLFGLLVVTSAARAVPAESGRDAPRFCEEASDCDAPGATCVAWLCRTGPDRARIERLHRVALDLWPVRSSRPEVVQTARSLHASLGAELQRSGFYEVLPAEAFPPGWRRDGTSLTELRRGAWLASGATLLVQLFIDDDGASASLRIRTVDLEGWGPASSRTEAHALPMSRQGDLKDLASAWVNARIGLDTGLPGALGYRIAGSTETSPGVKEIVTVRDDGSDWRQVTRNGSLNLHATWGPGGVVGWMSYVSGNTDWFHGGKPLSTRPGLNAAGAWSPDGRLLAIGLSDQGDSQLVLLDGHTGQEHARLTDGRSIATSPTWSPDGRRIAFVSDRLGGMPKIFVIELDTGRLEQITRDGYSTNPEWSPLGESLVFQRQNGKTFTIMRYDFETGQTRRLGVDGVSADNPSFSPDGRFIAFTVGSGSRGRLWTMTADGEGAAPLAGECHGRSFLSASWETPRGPAPD